MRNFKTTKELTVSDRLVDQIIGQEHAVEIIKKAAARKRHVLLIGTPGTGKSMLGQGLASMLPKSELKDFVAFQNLADENMPLIRTMPVGDGKKLIESVNRKGKSNSQTQQFLFFGLAILSLLIPWWIRDAYGDIMAAAALIGGMIFVGALAFGFGFIMRRTNYFGPKLLIDNSSIKLAPFIDATGAHAGALLGDVLHDPFQTGGLGTPAHARVQCGMIHKADNGVLFVDEVATLTVKTQQELLTALQEGKYPITGQSERSAGAMVRTEPAPCRFILVAAGNTETIQRMHPALRSRIRGYGYEVYMNDTMPDTEENQQKLAQFVAQEVVKDGKIPHFTKGAVEEIINEARRRASRKGHLTLVLRDLGGLVRAAGDIAIERKADIVEVKDIFAAKKVARNLEQQIADKYIEHKRAYEVIKTDGDEIGRVNGLAVIGGGKNFSGIVLPIEAETTLAESQDKKRILATGKLGKIAQEAIINVSAIIKKLFNADLKKYDIHVQFLQTVDTGVEGDSASIAVATSIISALQNVPIRQDTAMTGSLSIKGEVLPVGGVTAKVEAAIEAGLKRVIVPHSNVGDIILSQELSKKIKIIPAKTIVDVLENAMVWSGKEKILKEVKKYGRN